jgi:hypothetical protein
LARTTLTPSRVHNYGHIRGPSSLSRLHMLSSGFAACLFPSTTPHIRYCVENNCPACPRSDVSCRHCKCASFFRPQGIHSLSNPRHFFGLLTLRVCLRHGTTHISTSYVADSRSTSPSPILHAQSFNLLQFFPRTSTYSEDPIDALFHHCSSLCRNERVNTPRMVSSQP